MLVYAAAIPVFWLCGVHSSPVTNSTSKSPKSFFRFAIASEENGRPVLPAIGGGGADQPTCHVDMLDQVREANSTTENLAVSIYNYPTNRDSWWCLWLHCSSLTGANPCEISEIRGNAIITQSAEVRQWAKAGYACIPRDYSTKLAGEAKINEYSIYFKAVVNTYMAPRKTQAEITTTNANQAGSGWKWWQILLVIVGNLFAFWCVYVCFCTSGCPAATRITRTYRNGVLIDEQSEY